MLLIKLYFLLFVRQIADKQEVAGAINSLLDTSITEFVGPVHYKAAPEVKAPSSCVTLTLTPGPEREMTQSSTASLIIPLNYFNIKTRSYAQLQSYDLR